MDIQCWDRESNPVSVLHSTEEVPLHYLLPLLCRCDWEWHFTLIPMSYFKEGGFATRMELSITQSLHCCCFHRAGQCHTVWKWSCRGWRGLWLWLWGYMHWYMLSCSEWQPWQRWCLHTDTRLSVQVMYITIWTASVAVWLIKKFFSLDQIVNSKLVDLICWECPYDVLSFISHL